VIPSSLLAEGVGTDPTMAAAEVSAAMAAAAMTASAALRLTPP